MGVVLCFTHTFTELSGFTLTHSLHLLLLLPSIVLRLFCDNSSLFALSDDGLLELIDTLETKRFVWELVWDLCGYYLTEICMGII